AGGVFAPAMETGSLWEMRAEFATGEVQRGDFGLRLTWGDGCIVTVTYRDGFLIFDRTRSGAVGFNADFPAAHRAPLALDDGTLRLQLFVDHSSIELFANDGLLSLTERIFPDARPLQISFFAGDAPVTLTALSLQRLAAAQFAA
ncbi:MAG: glycoside hydrolase family 32 protein, partial [Chloroflexi bacterium]